MLRTVLKLRIRNLWNISNIRHICTIRAQELCGSRGGRPGFPVPNSPYGLCGAKATLNLNICTTVSKSNSMSKEDIAKWLNKPEMQATPIPPVMVEKWSVEICRRYSEDWRHYHTMCHLSDMMNHFHTWRDNIVDPASVVLAILFHE